MKKATVILSSFLGGAVVGSAITMFMTPKSGEMMRGDAQNLLAAHIKYMKDHIKRCKCMMMGDCEVPTPEPEAKAEM